jgi:hypothetical protein
VAVTEYGEPDLLQLWRIAVHTPHDDARQSSGLRLKDHEVANARFVEATPVVDDKDVAGLTITYGFEENVNTSVVSSRDRPAHDAMLGKK